jgi:hypothetical protein
VETSLSNSPQTLQEQPDLPLVPPGLATSARGEPHIVPPGRPDGHDLAEGVRIRRRMRWILLSLVNCKIGARLRRRATRRTVQALEAEHQFVGTHPGVPQSTYGESVVRASAKAAADTILDQTQRRLSRHVRRTEKIKARRATWRDRILLIPQEHVRHADGGKRTVAEACRDRDDLQAKVAGERARGSHIHDRVHKWFRRMPRIVLVFDLFLLLYFFSGVTDVNWAAPLSAALAFALGLAAMITAASYGYLAFAGHRLRRHKDHSGSIPLADLDWLTRLVTITAAGGILLLASLMFVRMQSEVLLALGPGSGLTSLVIAATLAGVSMLANILVVSVHALDGSDETDRLQQLGTSVGRAMARADRLRRRVERLDHVIAVRARTAHRLAASGVSRAGRPVGNADRIIDAARIPSQRLSSASLTPTDPNTQPGVVGYRPPEAMPRADERPLRLALEHVDSDLPSEVNGA